MLTVWYVLQKRMKKVCVSANPPQGCQVFLYNDEMSCARFLNHNDRANQTFYKVELFICCGFIG